MRGKKGNLGKTNPSEQSGEQKKIARSLEIDIGSHWWKAGG